MSAELGGDVAATAGRGLTPPTATGGTGAEALQKALAEARTRRILRFGLGVTLGSGLAYLIGFELPFLVPVLIVMLLGPPAARPKLRGSLAFVSAIAVASAVGVILSSFLLQYRIIFLLVEFLVLYRIFYALAGGAAPLRMVWLLIASLLIPIMGLASLPLSVGVAEGLVVGATIAIGVVWLTHGLLPDPVPTGDLEGGATAHPASAAKLPPPPAARAAYARRSVTVIFPVLVVFFLFGLTSDAILLVFIAVLSLNPDFAAGWKKGRSMIAGNLIGGVVAIAFYQILVVDPSLTMFLLLTLVTGLVFADLIFSERPIAPTLKTAFNSVVILIGLSLMGSGTAASSKFYLRIAQVITAAVYVAAAFGFLEYLQRKRMKSA